MVSTYPAGENVIKRYLTRLSVREGDQFLLLSLDNIRWMEAKGNYIRLHLDDRYRHLGGSPLQRDSLRRLESILDPERFVRISRYAIVNVDKVLAIRRTASGSYRLTLEGGLELSSSRTYRAALRRLLRSDPKSR